LSKYLNQERNIIVLVEIGEWLFFACCRASSDAESCVHYVLRAKWSERSDQTSKCLNQVRNIRGFVKIDEWLGFARCRSCFDAKIGLLYVRRAKWCENSSILRNAAIRNEISLFSSKSANGSVLRIAGPVPTLKAACTTFCVLNGEKRAANVEMSQSGT
jgi:hypothetical protein